MNVMLIDDEPAMLLALSQLLSRIDGVHIVGTAQSHAEAIAFAARHAVDLAFVDIMIAQDSGLDLAIELRKNHADLDIVFVTSHKDFALDAFDAYPLDYIVKPVTRKRLEETVARAARRRGGKPDSEDTRNQRLLVAGLGGLQTNGLQGEALKWMSRKSQELFAYLLLCRGQRIAKSRILEDLFHYREGKNSELYLNTALYQLRRTLSTYGLKTILMSDREYYQMRLEQIKVDFIDFEEQLAHLNTIDRSNIDHALAVEKMYTGDLFEDKSYEWALVESERLGDLYEAFAKRLVYWQLEHEYQIRQAIQISRGLVRRNELDEEANMQLMQGFALLKDWKALQAQYKQYETLLMQELHISPSLELVEWYERVRL
ncbi:Two-component response regulator, SAPR family, consists of REC, wHTH and BTAD domains [Paenibacillus sp. UNCCL117]|uniref:response regulator n=1 Tax=unclassified Paenibacillus TaxID=185978 RepID=UPI000891B495|nr:MULTISPECIES: response regulator [unclassified Paenibacillus]SDE06302.1 Two-component response regulator, SAPR family, consists of REC, wHTH and BTAD domains [Paenibacillus sp. cl123]SFW59458.1 Two-component response regulator, SAPR family, consists of REC, wHTH and BTAD domains [Paenibacillus sp. UNCCL117]